MVFEDYGTLPTEKEMDEKPNAIPYYPEQKKLVDYEVVLSSGKQVMFDLMTGAGERWLVMLPIEKQTKSAGLMARNLRLLVDNKWEKVENFSLFSVRDMAEIRKAVFAYDPVFSGNTEVENPTTGEKAEYPVMLSSSFFYLTEA